MEGGFKTLGGCPCGGSVVGGGIDGGFNDGEGLLDGGACVCC